MSIAILTMTTSGGPATADILADFGKFLRLHTAEGDASEHTVRSYFSNARQFVAWCQEYGVNPAAAKEDDLIRYRKVLVDAGYRRGTVAVKLAAVRRLYEAAQWRGLRTDNPAAGVKAPRERTAREERVKYLPLDGLKRVLAAPEGDGPKARRDQAILALMGIHGLRVAEVAGLQVENVDVNAGTIKVTGKGQKTRKVYLTEQTAAVLGSWLELRAGVALDGVAQLANNHLSGYEFDAQKEGFYIQGSVLRYYDDKDAWITVLPKGGGKEVHVIRVLQYIKENYGDVRGVVMSE